MTEIKTVLFDWAGVMAPDTREPQEWLISNLINEGVEKTAANTGVNECVKKFMTGTITEEEFWHMYTRLKPSGEPQDLRHIWELWKGGDAFQQMTDLVDTVRSIGFRAVVFSNVLLPCKRIIESKGGYAVFNGRVLSCDERLAKPEAPIYSVALQAAECPPDNCLFIDDVYDNLILAKRFGMQVIEAVNKEQVKEELGNTLGRAI